MLFIIYKTTYLPTKKIYIGQHRVKNLKNLDPWYVGSGSEIKELQLKDKERLGGYWRKLYKRDILLKIETDDIKKVNNIEVLYILKYDSINPEIGYNLIDKATIFDVNEMSEQVKAKISASMKGKFVGDKHPMYGKLQSNVTKKLISEATKGENNPFYGKKHTEETKAKLSEFRIGKTVSDYTKKRVSETHKGVKWSEDRRNKLSSTASNRKSITNGLSNSWLHEGQEMPQGWRYGRMPYRVKRKKRKDRINYGTTTGRIWINNGVENKMIFQSESVPKGWNKGMKR